MSPDANGTTPKQADGKTGPDANGIEHELASGGTGREPNGGVRAEGTAG
jgi:hypothetical protein